MKKKLLSLLLILAGFGLYAAPFKNMPVYFTQPDGTQYHCFASGDEYYHYLHDGNGFVIIQNQDGWFYYATHDANGEQVASRYKAGENDPASVGLQPNMHISQTEYRKNFVVYNSYPKLKSGAKGTHEGTLNNIIVYIKFHDDPNFINSRGYYDGLFNSDTDESLYNYYKEVSYDQLYIVAHHYPASDNTTNVGYTDIYDRSYYQPYNATTNPNGYGEGQQAIREFPLIKRAIESVKATIESQFTADELDINGDGIIDNICFIVRGENGNWSDLLWAHSWALSTYNVTIKGKRVYQYTWQPETQSNVYTFCHEMFHALGAPDLYHYNYDGNTNVGPWDLMESGFVHMGAWMKYKYADKTWVKEVPEISKAGTYTLKPLATSQDSNCFKIKSPNSESEFYVVEYRKLGGLYEKNCPGSGLLVYRIDSTLDGNAQGPPNEVYIYRPGGTTTTNGNINMAFFNNHVNRTQINDNTDPSGFLSDGSVGGLNISEIGDAGATISFNVSFDRIDQPENFFAQVSSSIGVGLYWDANANNDSVLIACSTSEISSSPVSGTNYEAGDRLYNGEEVIYVGKDLQEFAHTGLEGGTTYYYKIWSVVNARYSAALKTSATTYCDQTYTIPYNQEFKNKILPPCWNVDDPLHNNQVWEFSNIGAVDFNSFTEKNGIACINSGYYGLNQDQKSGLISPIFDFTNNDFIYLTFKHYLKVDLDRTKASLLYSVDSCKTWNEISSWTASTNDGELYEVDLSDLLAGQSSVRFKFNYEATADRYWCIDDFRILSDFLSVADIKNKTNSSVSPYRNKVVSVVSTVTKLHSFSGNIFTQDTSALWSGLPVVMNSGDDSWDNLQAGDSVLITAFITDDVNKVPQLTKPSITKIGTSSSAFTPYETSLDAILSARQMFSGLYVKISNLTLVGWDNDWFFDNDGTSVVIKSEDTDYVFSTGHIYNIAGIYFEKDLQVYLIPLSNNDITDVSDISKNSFVDAIAYPNPFRNELSIEAAVLAKVEILDVSGRVLIETSANEVGRLRINTEKWLPGAYLIRISSKNGTQMIKTIKTN